MAQAYVEGGHFFLFWQVSVLLSSANSQFFGVIYLRRHPIGFTMTISREVKVTVGKLMSRKWWLRRLTVYWPAIVVSVVVFVAYLALWSQFYDVNIRTDSFLTTVLEKEGRFPNGSIVPFYIDRTNIPQGAFSYKRWLQKHTRPVTPFETLQGAIIEGAGLGAIAGLLASKRVGRKFTLILHSPITLEPNRIV